MPAAIKILLLNPNIRKKAITIVSSVLTVILIIIGMTYYTQIDSFEYATGVAEFEYSQWQKHTPEDIGLSCQGQKYCDYFGYDLRAWDTLFICYCYEQAGISTSESHFCYTKSGWLTALEENDQLIDASNYDYKPQVGNVVFFKYGYGSGIITQVYGNNTITVITGGSWIYGNIERNTMSRYDSNIDYFGTVGSTNTPSSDLSRLTRNVIFYNENGIEYESLTENDYSYVDPDNRGTLAIGINKWRGQKALSLLKKAYSYSSIQIELIASEYGITGENILNAIKSNNDGWSFYIPNDAETECIKTMLLTGAGRKAQDETMMQSVQVYIDVCKSKGITDMQCIAYCSDILKQAGVNQFVQRANADGSDGVLCGVDSDYSLDDLYSSKKGWYINGYDYSTRRIWSYNYIINH